MGSNWGKNINLTVFGESHGKGVGMVIDGLPAGILLDLESMDIEMNRRKPGKDIWSTKRNESDKFEIVSGVFEGKTNGTPLCAFIANKDTHSNDYADIKDNPRPGHADYAGWVKYKGNNDYRGGGHFSGRLTAPIVLAGAIAKQVLKEKGIMIGSHVSSIGEIEDKKFKIGANKECLKEIIAKKFCVIDDEKGILMQEEIKKASDNKDSIGGTVECAILGLPTGIGSPIFESIESRLSNIIFAIPAVKGVSFGAGFDFAKMNGSSANDEYILKDGQISCSSNNNGGITGGITTGMPVIFNVAIKPTASIGTVQNTVNLKTMEETKLEIKGRHDPCIVPRVLPVIEGAAALAILDILLDEYGWRMA